MVVFSGTVTSDFLKLVGVDDSKKSDLIDYAATDFLTLRESLVNYLKAVYPLDYNYFSESDMFMMLIEIVSYMGAQLSMKADFLANENYLRTSRSRNSVKKLLELIGVRMKGPISSAANAKITLNSNPGWSVATDYLQITPANRVFNITSPEDGANVSFTLYKVNADGSVDLENNSTDIHLISTEKDSNTVFSNVVLLEGALVVETGQFSDTETIKSIPLNQSPVVEGSVQVFIDGNSTTSGIYAQVDNIFFASGPSDKVFQILSNDSYAATVVFGDSYLGNSPRVGDSYTIIYRVGGGSRGNIANEILNVPITTRFNSSTNAVGVLENTSKGTGGADAETIEHAKRYAPLTFRRQDRLVTLLDYKSFANSFITSYGSVGKATASVRRAYSSANIIDIFVLEKASNTQLRKATPEFKRQLLNAVNAKKMLTDEAVAVDGLIRTLDLFISVKCDSKYRASQEIIKLKVRDKVLSYFNVDNSHFGKSFNVQDLNRALFIIQEVRYSTIDNVEPQIKIEFNEIIQLNNLNINIAFV
jgi:hypothetical protein